MSDFFTNSGRTIWGDIYSRKAGERTEISPHTDEACVLLSWLRL